MDFVNNKISLNKRKAQIKERKRQHAKVFFV